MSGLRVELVYDLTCPNVDQARAAIRSALTAVDAPPVWQEWLRDDPDTPAPLRQFGSPSVLVNGQDVGGDEGTLMHADANSCRVYPDECGCLCGAPSAQLILDFIRRQR
jgi:hypothetical protein